MKNIIITGKPQSGKSTLIKKILNAYPYDSWGLVTSEELDITNKIRQGFKMEPNNFENKYLLSETIAHVNFGESLPKVSKYYVEVASIDILVCKMFEYSKISKTENEQIDLLYLDEIGQMQLLSKKFQKLALSYLNSPQKTLMTISSVFHNQFTNYIRKRDDVVIVEINEENRDEKLSYIQKLLIG